MSTSETPIRPTPAKDESGRFIAGNSGNGGRPKGARSKLGEAFIQAMCDDFNKHGVQAIEMVRQEKPDQYLKVIASILPKEITGEDGGPVEVQIIKRTYGADHSSS